MSRSFHKRESGKRANKACAAGLLGACHDHGTKQKNVGLALTILQHPAIERGPACRMAAASCPDKRGIAIDSAHATVHSREHTILRNQMDYVQRNPEPTAKHCRKHFLEPLATKERCIASAPLPTPIGIGDGLFAFARTFSFNPLFLPAAATFHDSIEWWWKSGRIIVQNWAWYFPATQLSPQAPLVGTLIGESIASPPCYKRRSPPSEVVRQTECQYRKKS